MKGAELVIYKASAGSGKTYALAKEYLKIVLLHPHDYKSILAVTFTRKATQEMKSRIVEYLGALQQQTPDIATLQNTIIEEIKAEKGVDISAYLRQNAEKALQLILHDYSNFQISTIDSFFQSIIRSFAKELDLPIGMEVELNTDAVLEEGVLNMLRDYHPGKDAFSEWIETYVYHQIEEDKSWKIERNISGFARQLFKEEYQRLVQEGEQVFDIESYKEVLLELQRIRKNYRDTLTKLTAAVEQRIAEEQLDITKYFQGARSVQSFIRKTAAFAPEANVYIQKMLDTGELLS
ncbi:MAG TPA: UvrD-helicase domain-containing protein, partial [Chitinophagales bacterium]|nr:UvrD-helicase domain-containing protein [Chitinophagales bacterium]